MSCDRVPGKLPRVLSGKVPQDKNGRKEAAFAVQSTPLPALWRPRAEALFHSRPELEKGASVSQQAVVPKQTMDQLCINTIRTLSIDAVQQANSGHPGAPMGLAPVMYSLWQNFLRYDPADPLWPNRDRFVLSAGHASMLLYSTLHLAGVRRVNEKGEVTKDLSVSMEEIKRFRQLGSCT